MLIYYEYLLFLNLVLASTTSINIQEKDLLETCFANIARKYLRHHTNVFIGPKFREISFSHSNPVIMGNSIEFLITTHQDETSSFTISYESVDKLNQTLTEIGTSNQMYFTVIANNENELPIITDVLWQFKLYKSVILFPNESKVQLYAIDLKNSKCGIDIKPKKINECKNGQFRKKLNLFSPNMKKSFSKCPIRIIWTKYPPWIFDNNDTQSGIFKEILGVFEEKSNFKLVYMPESDVYLEELAYYNFGSIVADFDRDYADVFVGLVGFSASFAYTWITNYIYDDNMYFVVPNPKMIPYWKLIGKLFVTSLWIFTSVTFFVLCALFTVIALKMKVERFSNFLNNTFYFFAITVNVGFYKFPRRFVLRMFLGIYLFAALIIVALMQGKYYSFVSSPLYEKRITSVERLLDSNVPIKFSEGLELLFLFPVGDEKNAKIVQRLEILPNKDLAENLKRAYNENFATITDRGLLIMNPYLKSAMQVFEIFSFMTCFLVKRNYVLYEYFTANLTKIVESGFVEKFVSQMKFKYSSRQYFKEENRFFRLTLTHMEGPFFILLTGFFVAIVGFALEHIYFRCKKFLRNRNY